MSAHRSRGAAHQIMAKHFVPFEVQQQQYRWYYQQLKRRRENDRECSRFGRSAAELFEMARGDCSTRSPRSTSFSDPRVVDQPVAKADDELSETEIEDDDGEGTLASPNDAQLTAESCSTWASIRDQSIFEIFDRIETQRRQERWRAITAVAKERRLAELRHRTEKIEQLRRGVGSAIPVVELTGLGSP